jgi:MGT family glycosyltransferase
MAKRIVNRDVLPVINSLRDPRGLSPLTDSDDLYLRSPLTIATTAPPFEYPRVDWHPSVNFVGPISWEPPAAKLSWIKDLDERTVVLLTGSSIPEAGRARFWIRTAIDALADEPLIVVATLPTDQQPAKLPRNVRVERFIPHQQILPRVSCVVCHGGPGITQRALAAGIPVVAVPFAYDRFEVARRVEVAGAGIMLSGRRLSPSRLRAAVRKAMSCQSGAMRIAAAFKQAGGAPAAAKLLEEYLERGSDHRLYSPP